MKKFITVTLLTLFLSGILAPLSLSDASGGQLTFTVANVQTTPGSEVKVPVTVTNNSGFAAVALEISYDPTYVSLEKRPDDPVPPIPALPITRWHLSTVPGYQVILLVDEAEPKQWTGNGVIVDLIFKVSPDAPDKTIVPVTLSFTDTPRNGAPASINSSTDVVVLDRAQIVRTPGSIEIIHDAVTDPVPVTNITVTGSGGSTSVPLGGNLQMEASISPASASNKNVIWSVSDPTTATIDTAGVLTPLKVGLVTVTATAADGSGVLGTTVIRITEQSDTPGQTPGGPGQTPGGPGQTPGGPDQTPGGPGTTPGGPGTTPGGPGTTPGGPGTTPGGPGSTTTPSPTSTPGAGPGGPGYGGGFGHVPKTGIPGLTGTVIVMWLSIVLTLSLIIYLVIYLKDKHRRKAYNSNSGSHHDV